eukprot:gene62-67_t
MEGHEGAMTRVRHHPTTLQASHEHLLWWKAQTCGDKRSRCIHCWLRLYQCHCSVLHEQQVILQPDVSILKSLSVEIILYYNYMEVGRSANTAHIFEALCPDITTHLVLGDELAEEELLRTIAIEREAGIEKTCMLYPTSTSISLNDWLQTVKQKQTQTRKRKQNTTQPTVQPNQHNDDDDDGHGDSDDHGIPSVRLILLDGTYPGASRVARFLSKATAARPIASSTDNNNNNDSASGSGGIPCVALDLHEKGLRSAVAGVMYQPAKDKICTFQAIALALQQVIIQGDGKIITTRPIGLLLEYLDHWIHFLLQSAIKLGKSKDKKSLKEVDNTPSQSIQLIMLERGKQNNKQVEDPLVKIVLQSTRKFAVYSLS